MLVCQLFLQPVVEMFAELAPGAQGVTVSTVLSEYGECGRRRLRRAIEQWNAFLLLDLNDMRGGPDGSGQVGLGSSFFACTDCETEGMFIRVYGKCCYPGAVRFLESADPLRAQYAQIFHSWPELARMAHEPMPTIISDSYVKAAMEAAQASPYPSSSTLHPCHTMGFKYKSVFVDQLPYWQPRTQAARDISHTARNRMLNILKLWQGKGNMKTTAAKMEFENSKGRFQEYAPRMEQRGQKTVTVFPRPPWQAKPSEIQFAMALLTYVRLPQGLHMPNFFEDKLTMADASLFFSGVGLFLLDILASIAPDQRNAFQAEMSAWSKVYHRKFSKSKLLDDHIEMARAVTLCEMALPMVDAGMPRHHGLEIFLPEHGHVARFGSPLFSHLDPFETYLQCFVLLFFFSSLYCLFVYVFVLCG